MNNDATGEISLQLDLLYLKNLKSVVLNKPFGNIFSSFLAPLSFLSLDVSLAHFLSFFFFLS